MLKYELNSRDRMIAAMNFQEPDHVPLFFAVMGRGEPFDKEFGFSFGNINKFDVRYPYSYRNQIMKTEQMLALGVDDTIRLEPPLGWAEEYTVEGVQNIQTDFTKNIVSNGSIPVMRKIYHTASGDLTTAVPKKENWPHGDNIPLFSDFAVPVATEYLIKDESDLPKLKHLFGEPRKNEMDLFKEEASELKKAARRLGVLFEGSRIALGDCLVWLMGIQNLVYAGFDNPGFIEELVSIIFEWEKRRLLLLLDEGVEIIFHSAWYEIDDFWTPELYRKILKPYLTKLVKITHQAGVKYVYIITKSYETFYSDFLDIGFDGLYGADPVQGNTSIKFLKDTLKGKLCLWGGVNSAVTLGDGSEDEIVEAVNEAIRELAPGGGFVLFPVDQLVPQTNDWHRTNVLLERWKAIGNYPICNV